MMKPNSMGRYWLFSLALYSFFGAAAFINITLNEYDAGTGSTTCDWHTLNMKHNISFSCLVDYTEDPLAKFVYFQILKQTDDTFNYLCDVDLRTDCTRVGTQNECSCIALREYLVEINVTVTARTFLNGAVLRGIAIRSHDNKEFISEERLFPEIFDELLLCDSSVRLEKFYLCLICLFIAILIGLMIPHMHDKMWIQRIIRLMIPHMDYTMWKQRLIRFFVPAVVMATLGPSRDLCDLSAPRASKMIIGAKKPQANVTRVQDLLPRKNTITILKWEKCRKKE